MLAEKYRFMSQTVLSIQFNNNSFEFTRHVPILYQTEKSIFYFCYLPR